MTSPVQAVFGDVIENAQGLTAAVAVLGKLNHKMYFRVFDEYKKQQEYFESLVYVSIDVLDECKDRKAPQQDMYLGFLCPVDEYQIYGYMTSTMIKFVLILSENHRKQESDLREFFVGVHSALVENVMNSLVAVDSRRIESPRFDAKLEKQVAALEKAAPAPSSRP